MGAVVRNWRVAAMCCACCFDRGAVLVADFLRFQYVDITCLICCDQTHFAFSVGHELVGPSFESVLWTLECFRHALAVSVCDVCLLPDLTLDDST